MICYSDVSRLLATERTPCYFLLYTQVELFLGLAAGWQALLGNEQISLGFYQIRQFFEAIHSRVKVWLELGEIAAESSKMSPSALIRGLLKGGKNELLWKIR